MYCISDIITSKSISENFLRSDEPKNTLAVHVFLDFYLINGTLYLFFFRLPYRNFSNTFFRAFKPLNILAIPYFDDFFSKDITGTVVLAV